MDRIISTSHERTSLFNAYKVLRNTYLLLSMTLVFSAITATVSTVLMLPSPGVILTIVGVYGLMFLTYKTANKSSGIISIFGFTGFLGYILGPILSMYLSIGMGYTIALALAGTALVFFCCSIYILTTNKDISFLSAMLIACVIVALVNTVINQPTLYLIVNAIFILLSVWTIMHETRNIIHGGETNYIRATVSLYVSLYNIFTSSLSFLGITNRTK